VRFRLADLAEILGQLRLQVEQLLPLEQIDFEMRRALGPVGRLDERAALEMQVFEDLGELSGLTGREARRQLRRGWDVERAVEAVGRAPPEFEISVVWIEFLGSPLRGVQVIGHFEAVFTKLIEPADDLVLRAVEEHAAAYCDHVAKAQNSQLNVLAIYASAVGAFEIGKNELAGVFLDLDVVTADALIVELHHVTFLAADRHRRGQMIVDPSAVGAVQNSQCHISHQIAIPFRNEKDAARQLSDAGNEIVRIARSDNAAPCDEFTR
jgi:hypothetical protein